MTNLYLPGATIISGSDSGPMLGGARKVVWHTTENDPAKTTAANVAHYLVGTGNTVHLVWHPLTGEIVQMIPANRGGKGLENHPGGVETNRAGTYVIQIEVVGRASTPFTSGPCVGLSKIQAWLASLSIPAVWSGTEDRSVTNWAKGGHFGHMDVPENSHTDPGHVDKTKLAGPIVPAGPVTPGASPVRGPFPLPVGAGYGIGGHLGGGLEQYAVKEIQTLLRSIAPGIAIDGNYGPTTRSWVGYWTARFGPYPTSVVNKQVWDWMAAWKGQSS